MAINYGYDEDKFWDSTLLKVNRFMDGAQWRYQQQATFDYILANLIGISCARMLSSGVEYPEIEDVYTNLFDEKQRIKQNTQKSINNFLNAAMAINKSRAAAQENKEVNS